MSSLPGGNIPSPVPGIPSTPYVARSNPDRQRREQQQQRRRHAHDDPAPAKREEDSADLSHHEDPALDPNAAPSPSPSPAQGPGEDHPHIDIEA